MTQDDGPLVLRISGVRQTGKTHALVAVANAASSAGPVTYLMPVEGWPWVAGALRAYGLRREVRVAGYLDRADRPRTVVVDEAHRLGPAGEARLLDECTSRGVLFLVLATETSGLTADAA